MLITTVERKRPPLPWMPTVPPAVLVHEVSELLPVANERRIMRFL